MLLQRFLRQVLVLQGAENTYVIMIILTRSRRELKQLGSISVGYAADGPQARSLLRSEASEILLNGDRPNVRGPRCDDAASN